MTPALPNDCGMQHDLLALQSLVAHAAAFDSALARLLAGHEAASCDEDVIGRESCTQSGKDSPHDHIGSPVAVGDLDELDDHVEHRASGESEECDEQRGVDERVPGKGPDECRRSASATSACPTPVSPRSAALTQFTRSARINSISSGIIFTPLAQNENERTRRTHLPTNDRHLRHRTRRHRRLCLEFRAPRRIPHMSARPIANRESTK